MCIMIGGRSLTLVSILSKFTEGLGRGGGLFVENNSLVLVEEGSTEGVPLHSLCPPNVDDP